MRSFLLAWNPKKFHWADIEESAEQVANGTHKGGQWSCGVRKDLPIGSRIYLIRLGQAPRGIFAVGITNSEPEGAGHWGKRGESASYVGFKYRGLKTTPLISMAELTAPPYDEFGWSIQGSGVEIPAKISNLLWKTWQSRERSKPILPAEEVADQKYWEGSVTTITVNAYERNAGARAACIDHFGYRCSACDIDFEETYGSIGREFIHVHHITPISKVGKSYEIDPIHDLRPVCPNCHSMLHRKEPPLSISDLRRLLKK